MTLTRQQRVDTARAAVDYLTGRTTDELATDVPNCPGWTVYNAAVHVARVCTPWGEMMTFLPAMRRVTGEDPGTVVFELGSGDGVPLGRVPIESSASGSVALAAEPPQALLAVWGRPHSGVEVIDGDRSVFDRWRSLPGVAFQFGTWE